HSGTKAFIVTRVGDAFMLGGMLLLFAFTGTFAFTGAESMATNAQDWWGVMMGIGFTIPLLNWYIPILLFAFLLLFMGAIGKSGQAPLQVWLPEAMSGPTSVSALIHAATMVKAGIYITARFLITMVAASEAAGGGEAPEHAIFVLQMPGPDVITFFFIVVTVIGAVTALMTATMGIVSNELKQILAFSTLSQLGYMMLGIGAAGLIGFYVSYGNTLGLSLHAEYDVVLLASIQHVISHGAFKALLFLASGGVIHAVHTKYVSKMGGLKKHMKKTWAVMWIGVLALAGIPPFSGFWSKDSIIEYAYELMVIEGKILAEGGTLIPIGSIVFIFSILAAACTIFYSFRLMGLTFYGPSKDSHDSHDSGHSDEHDSSVDNYPESEEHHDDHGSEDSHGTPHDPGPAMMAPLYILAAFTIIAFAVFPFVQSIVLESSDSYMEILSHMVTVKFSEAGIVPFLMTLGALAIGGIAGWWMYIKNADTPNSFVPEIGFRRKIFTFLRHRWYINEAYYWILNKFLNFAEWWRVRIDNNIIDGIDFKSASTALELSRRIRWFDDNVVDGFAEGVSTQSVAASSSGQSMQTGRVNDYVSVLIFGLGLMVIVVLLAMGVI
ncbi:MAG: proton-conducting transporter membrane subunit, partial [Candidatus Thorarchaeota archaeon]|nr:proton-conducting transporter membrane subunit [Candidatus Thorarchaeota archaeon]